MSTSNAVQSASPAPPPYLLEHATTLLYSGATGVFMPLLLKLFSTRTLAQIVVVLTAAVAMKALSIHYDFSWVTAFAAG
jgi:hypothetical protein